VLHNPNLPAVFSLNWPPFWIYRRIHPNAPMSRLPYMMDHSDANRATPFCPCNRLAKIWGVQHPVQLFVAASLKRWWELMACAVFTILGVYTAAASKGNVWLVGGSAFLAAAFFNVAASRAWRDEHDKYTGEVAKYERPDISGEAFGFIGRSIQGDDRSNWSASYELKFEVCSAITARSILR
jgi:hypothetical protein